MTEYLIGGGIGFIAGFWICFTLITFYVNQERQKMETGRWKK